MNAIFWLLHTIIDLVVWVLIAAAIFSWLVAFDVVNRRNRAVDTIGSYLYRITEPLLRPIRRVVPPLGGIDISTVILILALLFLQRLLIDVELSFAFSR